MTETKTLTISSKEANHLDELLITEPTCEDECFGEDSVISKTIIFDDGFQMDIKCCGVQYHQNESNLPWTEAVLFDQNGYELCCSEPSNEFIGEWILEAEGKEYVVNIDVEKEILYDVVLIEKELLSGLTLNDMKNIYSKLKSTEGFPLDLEAFEHECSAMGLITNEAFEQLYYDTEELREFVASILDDMEKESDDHVYKFEELTIYLSR